MSDTLVAENILYLKNRFGQTRPGLQYSGYNSFRNASLQALFACEEFRIKVLLTSHRYPDLYTYRYLSDIFLRMAMGTDELIVTQLKDPIEVDNEIDPALYLMGLFDNLCVEYEKVYELYWSPPSYPNASEVFCHRFQVTCDNCEKITTRVQNDWIKFLESNVWDYHSDNVSLIYRQYAKNNYIVGNNIGRCETCGEDITITRWYSPNMLIFSLIEYDEIWKIKLLVDEKFNVGVHQYSLCACICHEKMNTADEYYCCYAKICGIWYYFRDDNVRQVFGTELSQRVFDTSHILFYKKLPSNIPEAYITEVNSLIPKIFADPDNYYDETGDEYADEYDDENVDEISENNGTIDDHQQTSIISQPNGNGFDLIGATIGDKRGLFNRAEGVCYMNAALQLLFHCEAFRLHIFVGGHKGRFHATLRELFLAMTDNFGKGFRYRLTRLCEQFWIIFTNIHREFAHRMGSFSRLFILTILYDLNDEVKLFTRKRSEIIQNDSYRTKVNTSLEAWMQLMVRQKNSYIYRLFAIQRKGVSKCIYGHINSIGFSHSLFEYINAPKYLTKDNYDIQMMIGESKATPLQGYNCAKCSQKLFEYSKISRVSNAIIVELEKSYIIESDSDSDDSDSDSIPSEREATVIFSVNEVLVVCSQTYYCQAICVSVGRLHEYTYAKVGDDWWLFNDHNVTQVSTGCMLDEQLYKGGNKFARLVLYQKLSPAKRSLTASEEQLVRSIKPLDSLPPQTTYKTNTMLNRMKQYCEIQ